MTNIIIESKEVNGVLHAGKTIKANVTSGGDHFAIDASPKDLNEEDSIMYKARPLKIIKTVVLSTHKHRFIAVPK